MEDYYRQPKTAVIEGLSSALATIYSNREDSGEELNLTDEEIAIIENELTDYVLSRFNLTWKDRC